MTKKGVVDRSFNPATSEILSMGDLPRVTETVFRTHVLDLLARPHDPENMLRYRQFVPHLIHPLNVVSDNDHSQVLFVVPPLAPTPSVGSARTERGGMSASAYLEFANIQQSRGMSKEKLLDAFFSRTIRIPDPYNTVIKPILEILGRYNRTMILDTDKGPIELSWAALQGRPDNQPIQNTNQEDPYSDDMVL